MQRKKEGWGRRIEKDQNQNKKPSSFFYRELAEKQKRKRN